MRQKFFNVLALIFLVNGSSVWALEKSEVYDVASGTNPMIIADNNGDAHIVYESPVTYEVAKAIRDSKGHLHSVEGGDVILPGIWYSQSSNTDKWSDPISILGVAGGSQQPDIAIEKSGAIDLIWTGCDSAEKVTDIFFARSTDSGNTWTKPLDIANTPGDSNEPSIAVAPDDSIHVVWADTSRGEEHKDIYYSYSKDGGKTWGKDPLLPADDISNTPGESSQPAIAIGKDDSIHVAWVDSTAGETHPDIYYTYKTDASWSKPIDISNSPRVSAHPSIACGGNGKVYLSWSDNSRKQNAADIWCAIANRYGNFDKPINISSTPGVSSEPVMTADDNNYLGIVWSDTSNSPNKLDVYCRVSNNGGAGFSNVIDLSHANSMSKHPDVAIAGNKMVVTWEESDGSNKEIKITSMDIKDIAMGPALRVAPSISLQDSTK